MVLRPPWDWHQQIKSLPLLGGVTTPIVYIDIYVFLVDHAPYCKMDPCLFTSASLLWDRDQELILDKQVMTNHQKLYESTIKPTSASPKIMLTTTATVCPICSPPTWAGISVGERKAIPKFQTEMPNLLHPSGQKNKFAKSTPSPSHFGTEAVLYLHLSAWGLQEHDWLKIQCVTTRRSGDLQNKGSNGIMGIDCMMTASQIQKGTKRRYKENEQTT